MNTNDDYSRVSSRVVGAAVGAGAGAVSRALVIYGFYLYLASQRGDFFDVREFAPVALPVALAIAGFNGLWIGGIAGSTARPGLGALLGGSLSAFTCGFYTIFNPLAFSVWIVFMAAVGAGAGALGGYAGAAMRPHSSESQTDQRADSGGPR